MPSASGSAESRDREKADADWPLLEKAVDQKIEEQEEFVRWWRENVSVRHGLNRHSVENADRRSLAMSVDDAESLTGITQQQVSKWAKKLQKRDAYRAQLFGARQGSAGVPILHTRSCSLANNDPYIQNNQLQNISNKSISCLISELVSTLAGL